MNMIGEREGFQASGPQTKGWMASMRCKGKQNSSAMRFNLERKVHVKRQKT